MNEKSLLGISDAFLSVISASVSFIFFTSTSWELLFNHLILTQAAIWSFTSIVCHSLVQAGIEGLSILEASVTLDGLYLGPTTIGKTKLYWPLSYLRTSKYDILIFILSQGIILATF